MHRSVSDDVARLRGITSDCDERPSCTPSHSKHPVPHRRDTFLRLHNHLQHLHIEICPLPNTRCDPMQNSTESSIRYTHACLETTIRFVSIAPSTFLLYSLRRVDINRSICYNYFKVRNFGGGETNEKEVRNGQIAL